MPRLKTREAPFADVQRLLLGRGYNSVALSKVWNCSRQTAKARLDNPQNITLGELQQVCRSAHIPADILREAIKFS